MYIFTLIALGLFAFSLYKEPRKFFNAFFFIFVLFCIYLSCIGIFADLGLGYISLILMGLPFVLIPLFILGSGFFLIGNGFVLLKKEGFSKANLLSIVLGVAIFIFFGLCFWRYQTIMSQGSSLEYFVSTRNMIENAIFIYSIFSYFVFGFSFICFLLYSIFYNVIPKKRNYDFIIIHGAGLLGGEKPTPLLKGRIDKAIQTFEKGKKTPRYFIASGGQGADEKISEAAAIKNYLLEQGYKEEQILLEDKSTTTYENLLYSYEMGKAMLDKPEFLFVTSDYHVLRTSFYAKKIGLKGNGVGSRTASYYVPSAFIREFIALVVRLKWWYLGIYVAWTIFFLIL